MLRASARGSSPRAEPSLGDDRRYEFRFPLRVGHTVIAVPSGKLSLDPFVVCGILHIRTQMIPKEHAGRARLIGLYHMDVMRTTAVGIPLQEPSIEGLPLTDRGAPDELVACVKHRPNHLASHAVKIFHFDLDIDDRLRT